ncbi:UNC-50-like protein [Cystobasidium minutum MCA 4210]|uniref:UNC-50-like protein n=1 Tax=Cystobasidium minutum MCA 4210 TaxID=1397322 RepID=UPI0034CD25CC|eukprot:jgi/Rhomi1/22421/CE22420_454
MSLLPMSTPPRATSPANGFARGSKSAVSKLKVLMRRGINFKQMDFELAAWQITYLFFSPRRVYRNVYYHKQTKNTWARDDPALVLLQCGCLAVAGLLWGSIYAHYSFLKICQTILSMIFVDFLLVGILVATLLWAISNRFFTHSSHTHATDQSVEWAYSFDVHVNSFFPLFIDLYLAQLLLAPVLTRSNWVCLFFGNTLYLAAFAQYLYVTYLGYNALPFLIRSELLLFPIVVLFAGWVVSLLGFNVAKGVLGLYIR